MKKWCGRRSYSSAATMSRKILRIGENKFGAEVQVVVRRSCADPSSSTTMKIARGADYTTPLGALSRTFFNCAYFNGFA